jgi:hypothetical protein
MHQRINKELQNTVLVVGFRFALLVLCVSLLICLFRFVMLRVVPASSSATATHDIDATTIAALHDARDSDDGDGDDGGGDDEEDDDDFGVRKRCSKRITRSTNRTVAVATKNLSNSE